MTRPHGVRPRPTHLALALAAALAAALFRTPAARAQEVPSAHYARLSVSLVGLNEYYGYMRSSLIAGPYIAGGLSLGASVRIVVHHFLIQPSFGLGYADTAIGAVSASAVGVQFGIGLGAGVPITSHFSLSPMFRADFAPVTGGWRISTFGELPFTIHVGHNGLIEPYIDAGTAIVPVYNAALGVYVYNGFFLLAGGWRFGVTF